MNWEVLLTFCAQKHNLAGEMKILPGGVFLPLKGGVSLAVKKFAAFCVTESKLLDFMCFSFLICKAGIIMIPHSVD